MMTVFQVLFAGFLNFNGQHAPFQTVMLIQRNSDYENHIVQTDSTGHFSVRGRSFGQPGEWLLVGKISNDSCEVLTWQIASEFDTAVNLNCDISNSSKVEITWRCDKEIKHPITLLCWPDSINGFPSQTVRTASSLDTSSFEPLLEFPCRKGKKSFYLPDGYYYFIPLNNQDEGRDAALYPGLDIYYFEARGTMLTKAGRRLSANINSASQLKFYIGYETEKGDQ